MRQKITDVVKFLIIINVIVHLCRYYLPSGSFLPDLKLYFMLDKQHFQPYQLVTHMFSHAPGLAHLGFNMLSLFFLGPIVERLMGPKRFLTLYLLCGLGAIMAHEGINFISYLQTEQTSFTPILGASGAVYGVLVAFAVLFPNQKLMLLFPPIPIKAKYLAMGLIAFDVFQGVRGADSGIAHFAHIGGAVAGALLTWMWYKRR